jgi:hypothetical protein
MTDKIESAQEHSLLSFDLLVLINNSKIDLGVQWFQTQIRIRIDILAVLWLTCQ